MRLRYDLETMFKQLSGIAREMLSGLRRTWKLYPVTLLMVAISFGLYAVTRVVWAWEWVPYAISESMRFGSENFGWFADSLAIADVCGVFQGRDIQTVMEDFGGLGIIQFWDGQIWRLPISAYHHGSLLHVGGNLFVILLLGAMLEERVPRLWYAAYFVASAIFSVACQALVLDACVGLSGTGYAIFGTLLVLRTRDFELRRHIPRLLVHAGILSMLVCVPITWLGLMPIGNMAHFSGFGYGLVAGWVIIARRQVVAEPLFAGLHLALIPFCLLVSDPYWNSDYIKRKAEILSIRTDDPMERVQSLRFLVEVDPDEPNHGARLVAALLDERVDSTVRLRTLTELVDKYPDMPRYRISLVSALVQEDRRDDAWGCAIRGWDGTYDQSQQALIRQMQGLWQLMPGVEARENAEAALDSVFGARADAIKDKLDLAWLSVEANQIWNDAIRKQVADEQTGSASVKKKTGPAVDETSPDSAALGWRA